jgi:hypothetical protein
MKRDLALSALVFVALSSIVPGCGSGIEGGRAPDGGGGAGGGAQGTGGEGSGGDVSCEVDRPGEPFTFRVHNAGAAELLLPFGCGEHVPIEIETPGGAAGIGVGNASTCQVSCDTVFAGNPNPGCSDCGPGVGRLLPAGATVDIRWDRRVYVPHVADASCSGSDEGNDCALGVAVSPSATQQGALTVCTDTQGGGFCFGGSSVETPFTVDTSASEATIEVF